MFRLLMTLFILALVVYYVACLLQYMGFCQWTKNEITSKMWIPFYYFFISEPKPVEETEKPVIVLDSVDPGSSKINPSKKDSTEKILEVIEQGIDVTPKPRKRTKKVTNDE